jgi:uncharacterized protein YbcI
MADLSSPLDSAEELIRSADATTEPSASARTRLANAMAGLKKKHYGKGPEAAKAFIEEDYVFVVMEGGLLRHEETMLELGMEDEVRAHRLEFQGAVTATAVSAAEELLGRKVVGYHSQITFGPTRVFEIFVLEPQPGA